MTQEDLSPETPPVENLLADEQPPSALAPRRVEVQPAQPIKRVSMFKRISRPVIPGGVTAVPHTNHRGFNFRFHQNLPAASAGSSDINHEDPKLIPSAEPKPATTEPKRSVHWFPNQHGAWPMLLFPFWTGVMFSQFIWQDLVLFCFWVLGFFLFNALSVWTRSHYKERYLLPVKVWGELTLLFGTATIILLPALLEWGIFFVPLIVGLGYLGWRRKERSVMARTLSVIASGLMCMVTYDVGSGFSRGLGFSWLEQYSVTISPPMSPTGHYNGWTWVIFVTCAYIAYFWSTIPYVKSVTRKHGSVQFLHFSVFSHLSLAALALLACSLFIFRWWFFVGWLLLAARSFLLPTLINRGLLKVQLKRIGFAELVVSVLYMFTIFL